MKIVLNMAGTCTPNWSGSDHKFWSLIKEYQGKKIVIALSGGEDSVALFHFLRVVKSAAKLELVAAYVHHGGDNPYRNSAAQFCQELAKEYEIPFFVLGPPDKELSSESEMRTFRYNELELLRLRLEFDFVATAHHQQDLLETRLIRLIRGTGIQGLKAINVLNGTLFRPLLKFSKREIQNYLNSQQYSFCDDPSNGDEKYLRNWIRNVWLKNLESYREGAVSTLASSLESIAESHVPQKENLEDSFSRSNLLSLSLNEKKQYLARFLNHHKIKNFSQSHVEEVIKQLDRPQKKFKFRCANCDWNVNAEHVTLSKTRI